MFHDFFTPKIRKLLDHTLRTSARKCADKCNEEESNVKQNNINNINIISNIISIIIIIDEKQIRLAYEYHLITQ